MGWLIYGMFNLCSSLTSEVSIAGGVVLLVGIAVWVQRAAIREANVDQDRSELLIIGFLLLAMLSILSYFLFTFFHLRVC
jgi:hypothetical protein